jgi:hypothetical protein
VSLDSQKVLRAAVTLSEADVEMLAGVVNFVGVEAGLKERLLAALGSSQDRRRVDRLEPVIRRLDESEILWLSENPEQLRRRARGSARR